MPPRHEDVKSDQDREQPRDQRIRRGCDPGADHADHIAIEDAEHDQRERDGTPLHQHAKMGQQVHAAQRGRDHRREHDKAAVAECAVEEVGQAPHFRCQEEQPHDE